MEYVILCYDREEVVTAWTKAEDDAAIAKLREVQGELDAEGRLGPVGRLMPTTTATTVRKGKDVVILDGPFAETKEQLLGFYVVSCDSLDEAIAAARKLAAASSTSGAFEVRPLRVLLPDSRPRQVR